MISCDHYGDALFNHSHVLVSLIIIIIIIMIFIRQYYSNDALLESSVISQSSLIFSTYLF